MTSPQRRAEASSVSSTFHVAMAMLGARAFAEALELWADVIPTSTRLAASFAKFLTQALKLVRFRRHQVQAIVIPYIRLTRALHTGYTIQPVFEAEPASVPLDKLREDFVAAVTRFAPEALQSSVVEDYYTEDAVDDSTVIQEPDGSPYKPYRVSDWTTSKATQEVALVVDGDLEGADPDDIWSEEIDRLQQLLDEQEAWQEAEAQQVIDQIGRELLEQKLKALDDEKLSAQEADERQEKEHGTVGRRVAAHVERMVQNGGRHTEEAIARRDGRAIGYVRVHYPEGDPEPCSFCAMLISRGVVYKSGSKNAANPAPKGTSERRATSDNKTWQMWREGFDVPGAEFDKFHPLCHCKGEAVYSMKQFDEDARFQVNRELDELWQEEVAKQGYHAKEAEARWRQLIKDRNRKLRQERGDKEHAHA